MVRAARRSTTYSFLKNEASIRAGFVYSAEGFFAESCSKTAAKEKLPAPFDLTTRTDALKAFSGVTLASGTAALHWSCTTPLRLALPTCAVAIAVSIRMSPGKSKNTDKTCAARKGVRGRMRFLKSFK